MKEYKNTGYYVNSDGTVIGKYGKLLKPRKRGQYLSVRIHNGDIKSGNISIHRMVAETYIPNPMNKSCVNHIDGDKHNNCVSNLEWVSKSENQKHAYSIGLQKQIKKIDDIKIINEYESGLNGLQISKKYSVNFKRIYQVIKNYKQKT
jgi:hypothetical protein